MMAYWVLEWGRQDNAKVCTTFIDEFYRFKRTCNEVSDMCLNIS